MKGGSGGFLLCMRELQKSCEKEIVEETEKILKGFWVPYIEKCKGV